MGADDPMVEQSPAHGVKLELAKARRRCKLTTKVESMSELQVIESALAKAARRRRWERALHGFGRGLFIGGILLLVALAAYKLLPLHPAVVPAAAIGASSTAIPSRSRRSRRTRDPTGMA